MLISLIYKFKNLMHKKLKYIKYYAKVLLNNWTVKKDSYAQHGEDKLVEQLLPNGVHSFIDIGANDGVLFSNTYKFAKMEHMDFALNRPQVHIKNLS